MSHDSDTPQGSAAAARFTEGFLQPFIGDFGYLSQLVRELQESDDAGEVRRLTGELEDAEEAARQLLELSPAANFLKDADGVFVLQRVHEDVFLTVKYAIRDRVNSYLEYRSLGQELRTEGMDEVAIDSYEMPLVYLEEILGEDYETYLGMPSGREEILQRLEERFPALTTDDLGGEADASALFKPFAEEFGPRTFDLCVNACRDQAGEVVDLVLAGDEAAGEQLSDLETTAQELLFELLKSQQ